MRYALGNDRPDERRDDSPPRRRGRLRRVVSKLRDQVVHYKNLFMASAAVAVLAIAALIGFLAFDEDPAPRPLGVGRAGVMVEDTSLSVPMARQMLNAPATWAQPPADDRTAPGEPADERGRALRGGEASYYGSELTGNPTASGERFDPSRLTAAHRTLPFGSRVRVTNVRNGESVVVRINDRGPFAGHRVIDLSAAAARSIGLLRSGTGRVELELLPS